MLASYYAGEMGFLDNLENNLKALESQEEKDPAEVQRRRSAAEAARAAALRRAPFAEALRTGAFTEKLLTSSRAIGFGKRVLVQFTWLEETLRLDAREKRVELTPTDEGVRAVYSVDGVETESKMVDLAGDGEAFARDWLA
ncbi:MAG: hypothetical protein ABI693_10470 [Bryobacteraceae bacterium]